MVLLILKAIAQGGSSGKSSIFLPLTEAAQFYQISTFS